MRVRVRLCKRAGLGSYVCVCGRGRPRGRAHARARVSARVQCARARACVCACACVPHASIATDEARDYPWQTAANYGVRRGLGSFGGRPIALARFDDAR